MNHTPEVKVHRKEVGGAWTALPRSGEKKVAGGLHPPRALGWVHRDPRYVFQRERDRYRCGRVPDGHQRPLEWKTPLLKSCLGHCGVGSGCLHFTRDRSLEIPASLAVHTGVVSAQLAWFRLIAALPAPPRDLCLHVLPFCDGGSSRDRYVCVVRRGRHCLRRCGTLPRSRSAVSSLLT